MLIISKRMLIEESVYPIIISLIRTKSFNKQWNTILRQ